MAIRARCTRKVKKDRAGLGEISAEWRRQKPDCSGLVSEV